MKSDKQIIENQKYKKEKKIILKFVFVFTFIANPFHSLPASLFPLLIFGVFAPQICRTFWPTISGFKFNIPGRAVSRGDSSSHPRTLGFRYTSDPQYTHVYAMSSLSILMDPCPLLNFTHGKVSTTSLISSLLTENKSSFFLTSQLQEAV